MSESREFEVKALSRVEGEGRLYVRVSGQQVEAVELNIYEPPRFFESFLRGRAIHEVPDITARICGICPVAYQMSSCHALEHALGIEVTPDIAALRRVLYCGEWIESHSLHIHLLNLPDFLGYDSGIEMAVDHRPVVERGLRMKKIGNQLLEILGGRPIHPINVTVGGFYRAPSVSQLRQLRSDLAWGLEAALETVEFVAQLDFPESPGKPEDVSLRHPQEYPMNQGRIVSTRGIDIPIEAFEEQFAERHRSHSTALHAVRLPDETAYRVGPLARINQCLGQLPRRARQAAETCGISWPTANLYHGIVARAIEVAAAFEEAFRLINDYHAPITPSRIDYKPQAGEGSHATEAPRGLLYHRYRIGDDGLIAEAQIVPPTSQNQGQIEDDLRDLIPDVLHLDDAQAARRCENLIRSYDPCISCATHFLTVKWDRPAGSRELLSKPASSDEPSPETES